MRTDIYCNGSTVVYFFVVVTIIINININILFVDHKGINESCPTEADLSSLLRDRNVKIGLILTTNRY